MYINGKWMTEPEIEAHIAKLKKHCKEMQAENADLKQRISELEDKHWNECRQIAHYDDELKEAKRLLKAAVEGYHFIGHITSDYACPSCTSCSACPMDEGKQCKIWKHADEALALIGEDINVTAREDGERNDNCLLR